MGRNAPMTCPERALLSAYLDREANPSEERRVDLHLADCADCRRTLRLLARLKGAVRAQPSPALPADLRGELEALARSAPALPGLARPWTWAAAALAAAAWLLWPRGPETAVPVDLVLAAHDQYALTMPLARAEEILTDPVQVAAGGPEEGSDAL